MADQKTAPLPPAQFINTMRVRHSQNEFYFDFGQISDVGDGASGIAHLIATIVTTPAHAKAMLRALETNIGLFEQRFGLIEESAPQKLVKQ